MAALNPGVLTQNPFTLPRLSLENNTTNKNESTLERAKKVRELPYDQLLQIECASLESLARSATLMTESSPLMRALYTLDQIDVGKPGIYELTEEQYAFVERCFDLGPFNDLSMDSKLELLYAVLEGARGHASQYAEGRLNVDCVKCVFAELGEHVQMILSNPDARSFGESNDIYHQMYQQIPTYIQSILTSTLPQHTNRLSFKQKCILAMGALSVAALPVALPALMELNHALSTAEGSFNNNHGGLDPTRNRSSHGFATQVENCQPGHQTHTIQPGENLYRIALNYGLTVQQIADANNIPNPDQIRAGDTLIIPIGGPQTCHSSPDSISPTQTPEIMASDFSINDNFGTEIWTYDHLTVAQSIEWLNEQNVMPNQVLTRFLTNLESRNIDLSGALSLHSSEVLGSLIEAMQVHGMISEDGQAQTRFAIDEILYKSFPGFKRIHLNNHQAAQEVANIAYLAYYQQALMTLRTGVNYDPSQLPEHPLVIQAMSKLLEESQSVRDPADLGDWFGILLALLAVGSVGVPYLYRTYLHPNFSVNWSRFNVLPYSRRHGSALQTEKTNMNANRAPTRYTTRSVNTPVTTRGSTKRGINRDR